MPLATGPDTAWERSLGTLPLLVAAPHTMLPVFAGRSAFHVVQGVAEGSIVFGVLTVFFGLPEHWGWVVVGLLAIGLGSYGLGVLLAAIAIRWLRVGNILLNFVFYTIVAIGGVNVATAVFPAWVERIAAFLPVYYGLIGLRSLLADGYSGAAIWSLGVEVMVGLAWFVLALAGFHTFAERGRANGSIVLSE